VTLYDKKLDMKINLITEKSLDTGLCFDKPLSENVHQPEAIFLTGATGFIGAFLLNELLQKTTADIYCLVRNNSKNASHRLKENRQFYKLISTKDQQRVIPVLGDLSLPNFGLSNERFQALGQKIDLIYHSAARMNPIDSYEVMKETNVSGTREILHFAAICQTKPIHYISTLGVFSNTYQQNLTETEQPEWNEGLISGYNQSKWVAEQLLITARNRGLPLCIYRPDIVLGHSQTGIINFKDYFLCNVLLTCIQLGTFPLINTLINFMPVDYVSQSIIYLSQQKSSYGKNFHLSHPHPLPWEQLGVEINTLGYRLKNVSYQQWVTKIISQSIKNPQDKRLSIMRKRFELNKPIYLFSKKPTIDATNTNQGLTHTGIICPPIDSALLKIYLDYFQNL